MMVTLLMIAMFSITPLMFTTVPGGSGGAVGVGVFLGGWVGAVVGVGTTVLAAAGAATVIVRARSTALALSSPWMCAIAPLIGAPVITVCASRTTGVPATTQRSWASCSIVP